MTIARTLAAVFLWSGLWCSSMVVAATPAPVADCEVVPCEFVKAVDGDTVVVLIDKVERRVRLLGVQCPEVDGHAAGFAAAAHTARECEQAARLELEVDPAERTDRYGRILAWVWCIKEPVATGVPAGGPKSSRRLLNTALVRSGDATIYPSTAAARYFEELQ